MGLWVSGLVGQCVGQWTSAWVSGSVGQWVSGSVGQWVSTDAAIVATGHEAGLASTRTRMTLKKHVMVAVATDRPAHSEFVDGGAGGGAAQPSPQDVGEEWRGGCKATNA